MIGGHFLMSLRTDVAVDVHAKTHHPFACNSTPAPYDETFLLRGPTLGPF